MYWPKDLLPLDIPGARIVVWGYDTRITFLKPQSRASILHHTETLLSDLVILRPVGEAQIPLIFIAHSLGGIIVKDALIRSKYDSTAFKLIQPATLGVIFLGTPHHGSEKAKLATTIAEISRICAPGDPNTQILRALELNSELLQRIATDFNHILSSGQMHVHSFSEELKTNGMMIVESDSAAIRHTRETRSTLHADHRTIARYSSREDPNFGRVAGVLQRWIDSIDSARATISASLTKLHTGKNSSDLPADDLYNRCLALLDDPQSRFRMETVEEAYPSTYSWLYNDDLGFKAWLEGQNERPIFWISGKPGSGKSTLMKYAMTHDSTRLSLQRYNDAEWLMTGYFFHDRGSDVQKSIRGFLSEFLFQLLCKDQVLFALMPSACRELMDRKADWDVPTLSNVLLSLGHRTTTPINCCLYIDALDEEDGDHVRLIGILTQLAHLQKNPNVCIRLCLAGRPENILQRAFEKYPGFAIHEYTESDIRHYTQGRLVEEEQDIVNEQDAEALGRLVKDIVERARGVFLWVRLVVAELVDGLVNGDTLEELAETLSQIPDELFDLYARALRRRRRTGDSLTTKHKAEAYYMCQMVCHAIRPIPLKDIIQAAIFFSTGKATTSARAPLQYRQMHRRLNCSSAGLLEAENTTTKGQTGRAGPHFKVQFMHQTVKEFMLDEQGSNLLREIGGVTNQEPGKLLILRYIIEHLECGLRWPLENFHRYARAADVVSSQKVDDLISSKVLSQILQDRTFGNANGISPRMYKLLGRAQGLPDPPRVRRLLIFMTWGLITSLGRNLETYDNDIDTGTVEFLLEAGFEVAFHRSEPSIFYRLLRLSIITSLAQAAFDSLTPRFIHWYVNECRCYIDLVVMILWIDAIQRAGKEVPEVLSRESYLFGHRPEELVAMVESDRSSKELHSRLRHNAGRLRERLNGREAHLFTSGDVY